MTDTIYEIYDNEVMRGHELLGKIYKSEMTKGCLESYTRFVKENRNEFISLRKYLAGVTEGLSLFDVQLNRSEQKLPFDLRLEFESNLEVHVQNFVGDIPWELKSMWVNFMQAGDFQPTHMHTGSLSFVWYIDVPQEIYANNDEYIRESDPDGSSPYGEIHFTTPSLVNPWGYHRETFRPSTGELLLFDSRYLHTVYPYTAQVERISISGNIEIQKRMNIQ